MAMAPMEVKRNVILRCKDHTVSGKFFDLIQSEEEDLLITFPQPLKEELPGYYKSDQYISHTDSDKGLINKTYQRIKSLMLSKKLGWISRTHKCPGNLLDVGAGTGDFLRVAKSKGWNTYGIEPDPDARSLAISKGVNLEPNLETLSTEKFDVITLWHVLEHLPELNEWIVNLEKLLKPNGLLVVAVPNHKSYDAKRYAENWAAYDVPRHLYHFTRSSIHKIFQKHGLKVEKERGMIFDSFYVSLLSEKISTGRSKLLRAFFTGLASNIYALQSKEYSSIAFFLKKC